MLWFREVKILEIIHICYKIYRYIKTFEEKCKRFGELQYFWYGLSHSEAREGFQEVHIVPNFNENEFRKEIRNYIEEHFPHEQEPKVIIKEKEIIKSIETESKPDFLRVAHELLFGFGQFYELYIKERNITFII